MSKRVLVRQEEIYRCPDCCVPVADGSCTATGFIKVLPSYGDEELAQCDFCGYEAPVSQIQATCELVAGGAWVWAHPVLDDDA